MKPKHLLALVAGLGLAPGAVAMSQDGAAPATQPSTQPSAEPEDAGFTPPPQALELLRQLDDPDYERREQAELDLFALILSNPKLEPWIANAARHEASPEVRTRAAGIVAKLAEHRLLGATLVTLDVDRVHPRELLKELSSTSGVRFEYWPQDPWDQGGAPQGKVSLQLQAVPFWEAMRRASEVTGIVPVEHQQASRGAIVLSPHGESLGVAPTIHHGAFAVQLRRLYRGQTAHVELGVGPDGKIGGASNSDSSLNLEMRLLVEPKVRLTGSVTEPIIEEVIDEHGRNLLFPQDPRRAGRGGWTNSNSSWSVQASVMLDAKAAARSQSIARFKGRMEAEIATAHDAVDVKIADLVDIRRLRETEKKDLGRRYEVGQYKVELISIQKGADQSLQVEFSISWDQAGDDQQNGWARAQALVNSLRLEDAAGRPWASMGGGNGWDGTVMKATRTFHRSAEDAGTPERLLLEVPTRVMTVTIPFEFTGIPLPQWE